MTSYDAHLANKAVIEEHLKRDDLSADDVLKLTIARKLNSMSDRDVAQALSGGSQSDPPLNFWNKR